MGPIIMDPFDHLIAIVKQMMAMLDAHHERIMAPLGKTEATDFKANPEEMESVTEQQEIPKEEAAVLPVGEPRKPTLEKCEWRKEFADARIRMTRCAKVIRLKGGSYEGLSLEQGRLKNKTMNKTARGTRIGRTVRRSQLMCQKGTDGSRN
jgi:hypothetical protein